MPSDAALSTSNDEVVRTCSTWNTYVITPVGSREWSSAQTISPKIILLEPTVDSLS